MLQGSEEFVIKHPSPSSVLCTNKVYFKAPSPTLDWLACEMNCFKSIHHREGHGISEECVFVGRQHGGRVSGGGDSGALIYDIDIDTTDGCRQAYCGSHTHGYDLGWQSPWNHHFGLQGCYICDSHWCSIEGYRV